VQNSKKGPIYSSSSRHEILTTYYLLKRGPEMELKIFSLWSIMAFLLLLPAYDPEAFAQQGGYGGYNMGSGMMGEGAWAGLEGFL
jgi:hypothetical protein